MRSTLFLAVILVALALTTYPTTTALRITWPPSMQSTVVFSPANFGNPYYTGASAESPLRVAYPMTACTNLFNGNDGAGGGYEGSVLLVYRGGCTFSQKALMAQAAGCHGVVIVDESITNGEELFVMADDGNGHAVTIPAALVTRMDGHRMVTAVRAGMPVKVIMTQDMTFHYNY
eukprot:PhM_4_TR9522/c0_g1_i2/m.70826